MYDALLEPVGMRQPSPLRCFLFTCVVSGTGLACGGDAPPSTIDTDGQVAADSTTGIPGASSGAPGATGTVTSGSGAALPPAGASSGTGTTRPDTTPEDPTAAETTGGPPPPAGAIRIEGRQIRVGDEPFHIRGVCWNPVPRGGSHPADLDFADAVESDAMLMAEAGINVVRTYEPITDRAVLDHLHHAGIRVIDTVYAYGGNPVESAVEAVRAVADHPAILMWVIGNEWNYNGLYVDLSHDEALMRLNEVAAAIAAVDDQHPIATVYGELPSPEIIEAMPDIDVWGLNVYRGIGFGSLFTEWAARSDKPFFLGEYGADAWNANVGAEDQAAQAEATRALTDEIWAHASARSPEGTCAGGAIFEWSDEWWKDASGSPDAHDIGGVAPGGGPHPDQTFNEEWWGLVEVDRTPREAYTALAEAFADQTE